MPPPKKPKNPGQTWLPEIQKGVEESFQSRPLGMPSLAVIKTETDKLGLPATDAEAIYDAWLVNGFKTKLGKIRNWKAAVRTWHRNSWFPSQRKPETLDKSREAIKARIRRMKGER